MGKVSFGFFGSLPLGLAVVLKARDLSLQASIFFLKA